MNSVTPEPLKLPIDDEIEKGLLGALLVHNPAYEKVSDFLRPEHFHYPVHGRIYAAIAELLNRGQSCSAPVLKKAFENDDDLSAVGAGEYLVRIISNVISVFNVEEYGRTILDLYQRRQVIEICDMASYSAKIIEPGASAVDLITETEAKLYAAAEGSSTTPPIKAFSTAISEALESAGAAYRKDPSAIGVSMGLVDLDKLCGGLRKPDLFIMAGRPGMGKSALALNTAQHIASLGMPVAFFSLEMSAEQLATRLLAANAGLSADLIRRGDVNRDQFQAFAQGSQKLASLPLYIDDSAGQTIPHIRKAARRMKRQHGLALIVVDYLQLIRTPGKQKSDNRVQEVSEITAALKNIAKEFEVPVLALSQLSRQVEQRDDKRPKLSDLRESGSIEQDADIVTFIFREEYYLENGEPTRSADEHQDRYQSRHDEWMQRKQAVANKAEVIVAKNRHGATGTAYLHFDGPTTTFSNLAAYYSVAGVR